MALTARRARSRQLPDPRTLEAVSISPDIVLPKGFSFPVAHKRSTRAPLLSSTIGNEKAPLQQLEPSPVISTPAEKVSNTTTTTTTTTATSSPRMTPSSPTTTATTSDFAESMMASTTSHTTNTAISKSWADLVRSPNRTLASPLQQQQQQPQPQQDNQKSTKPEARSPRATRPSKVSPAKQTAAAPETVQRPVVDAQTVIPRGLVNSGNLCFINAVLQLIVYTKPFWQLCLDLRHNSTNDLRNPRLLDAIISFLSEFRMAGSDTLLPDMYSAQPGPSKLGPQVVQDAPFVPTQVYESLKGNKRFDSMRRGTQEDAEEFLGFLLETLHEELVKMDADEQEKAARRSAQKAAAAPEDEDWVEVGTKGKVAVTRTTELKESALTEILGGSLRSTLRCTGNKDSVTLEPFQRLQLDIQPAHVRSVDDALLHLCAPEQLPDFHPRTSKQLSFDTLPPILILHLKRFSYTASGGVQKSAKRIQYRDVLEIDERCISAAKRTQKAIRYRLYGVVYHHGTSAHGGHYTVALRSNSPQVGFVTSTVTGAREATPAGVAEWIHIDDTNVRAVSPHEVFSPSLSGPSAGFTNGTASKSTSFGSVTNGNAASASASASASMASAHSAASQGAWTDVLRNHGHYPSTSSPQQPSSSPRTTTTATLQQHGNEDNERDAYLLCYYREAS